MSTFTTTPSTAWLFLAAAGGLEVVWALAMKASHGFTRLPYTALTFVAAWLSFWLLALAMKHLPLGTAYAIWTGVGTCGAAVMGMAWLGEPTTPLRVGCIALIVAGVLGLKLSHAA